MLKQFFRIFYGYREDTIEDIASLHYEKERIRYTCSSCGWDSDDSRANDFGGSVSADEDSFEEPDNSNADQLLDGVPSDDFDPFEPLSMLERRRLAGLGPGPW